VEHWFLIYKTPIEKIYVLGAGAVGCYFGRMLALSKGKKTEIGLFLGQNAGGPN
jgi:hypothetical protein